MEISYKVAQVIGDIEARAVDLPSPIQRGDFYKERQQDKFPSLSEVEAKRVRKYLEKRVTLTTAEVAVTARAGQAWLRH